MQMSSQSFLSLTILFEFSDELRAVKQVDGYVCSNTMDVWCCEATIGEVTVDSYRRPTYYVLLPWFMHITMV